ncbi:MAG TPA: hypothetical protein VIL36_12360 [Acidimicrobiales bacterium]
MTDARAAGSWLVADERDAGEAAPAAPPSPAPSPSPSSGSTRKEVVPGFYAGTSKGAPPPIPTGRKVTLAVGGAAVAVALLGGAVLALQGGGDPSDDRVAPATEEASATDPAGDGGTAGEERDDPAARPPAAPATDGATDPTGGSDDDPAAPADGDGTDDGADGEPVNAPPVRASEVVQVTDQGWYVAGGVGSYGFTVVNTSDHVLGSFVVSVKAYDPSGRVISGLDAWRHVIGTLQPYQELVVADLLHSESQVASGIGRLEIEVTELTSSDAGVRSPNDVPPGTVAVGDIERTQNLVRTKVTYRAASTYEVPLDAIAYLVFRNASGRIVGGARSFIDLPADGSAEGDFDIPTALVSPDATKVEVHVVPQLPL